VQLSERTRGEHREGVVVAAPGANDEITLHRAPGSWRASWPRSPIKSRAATQTFHIPIGDPPIQRALVGDDLAAALEAVAAIDRLRA
jgi:hypothetical protein